jgi:hypothetical protein
MATLLIVSAATSLTSCATARETRLAALTLRDGKVIRDMVVEQIVVDDTPALALSYRTRLSTPDDCERLHGEVRAIWNEYLRPAAESPGLTEALITAEDISRRSRGFVFTRDPKSGAWRNLGSCRAASVHASGRR